MLGQNEHGERHLPSLSTLRLHKFRSVFAKFVLSDLVLAVWHVLAGLVVSVSVVSRDGRFAYFCWVVEGFRLEGATGLGLRHACLWYGMF